MLRKALLTHSLALMMGATVTWFALKSLVPASAPNSVMPQSTAPLASISGSSSVFSSIKSMNVRSGEEAVKLNFRFRSEHGTLLNRLSDKCRGENSIRTRVAACQMLGELGENTPNQVLLNSILLSSPESEIRLNADSLPVHQDGYPAAFALIRIGDDAIPKVIYELRTTDEDDRRRLLVSVLRSIDGFHIALYRLQRVLAYEFDSKREQRIKKAIELLPKVEYYAPQILNHPLDDPSDAEFRTNLSF